MLFRVLTGLLCILFVWAGSVSARESMTLDQALEVALKQNPLIKADKENVTLKKMEKFEAFSDLFLPTVSVSYNYLRYNEQPYIELDEEYYKDITLDGRPLSNTITGIFPDFTIPIGNQDNYQFTTSVSKILFAGGALFNSYRSASQSVRSTEIDTQKNIRELKIKVIEAYYGVIAARQAVAVAKSGVASVKSHVDQAQAFYRSGVIPKNDLLTAQVKYAESQQALITFENVSQTAEAGFNLVLARPISTPVEIDTEIPQPPLDGPFESLIDTAMQNRQELKSLELQAGSLKKKVYAARGALIPTVAANYTYTRWGEDPDVPDASWTVGLGLQWTLLGRQPVVGGTNYSNLVKSNAAHAAAQYALQSQRDQVTFEVKRAYLSALEARAKIDVGIKAVEQAEENLRILKQKYNLQSATSTDVLDAQAMLDKARTTYITARTDYATAIAKLHASMGIL